MVQKSVFILDDVKGQQMCEINKSTYNMFLLPIAMILVTKSSVLLVLWSFSI